MNKFNNGDKVYYLEGLKKVQREVDYVADGRVHFTNGNWMPANEVHHEYYTGGIFTGESLFVKAQTVINDPVNQPAHYTKGGIETLDFLKAKMSTEQYAGFLRGNVLKYVTRYEDKNGVEDLRKAEFYLRELIKVEEGN